MHFRLTVPAAATPGDYAGGIILEAPPRQGTPGEVGDKTAVKLNVIERVGVRIYLKVSGTVRAQVNAGALKVKHIDGAIAFALPVTNTGNVILKPATSATVRGILGAGKKLTFTQVEELLPGQTVTVRATWQRPSRLIWANVDATVKHAGGTERVQADVRRVPVLAASIIAAVSLLVLWLCVRAVRTVQKARRVLGQQAPPTPQPFPPDTFDAAADVVPLEPVGQSIGRHRA